MADSIEILVPKESIDSVLALDASITKLDISYKKIIGDIEKGSKVLQNNKTSLEGIAKAQGDAAKSANEMDKLDKKLLTTGQQIEELNDDRATQLIEQQELLKNKKKAIRDDIKAEGQQVNSIAKLRKETKELVTLRDKQNTQSVKGRAEIARLNKAIDTNNSTVKENTDALGKQKINVGNYQSALDGLPGGLGAASRATKGFGAQLKLLAANPIVLTITALVAGIGLLFAAFKRTQGGADSFSKVMAKVSAVFDAIIGRVSALANAVKLLLKGKFKEAGAEAKAAFTGMRKEIKETVAAAGAIEDLKISIFEEETEAIKRAATRRREIAELIILTRDLGKSYAERSAALVKAGELEIENLQDQLNLQEMRVKLAADEIAATPERLRTREQERTLTEATAQLEQLRTDSLGRQREILNRQTEASNANRAAVAKLNTEEQKRLDLLTKQEKEKEKQVKATIEQEEDALKAIQGNEEAFDDWLISQEEKLQDELTKVQDKGIKDRLDKTIEGYEEERSLAEERTQAQLELTGIAGDAALGIYINRLDAQSMALELDKKRELALAGDSADEKAKIEAKFAKKQGEIKTKQARADKISALFNIAINTAQAISKITAQTGVIAPLAIPLAIAAGVAQAALVLSQPIPQYTKGTGGRYDTPGAFITSEHGQTEAVERGGKTVITNKPTLFRNSKGSRVYSNKELQRYIDNGQVGYDDAATRAMHQDLLASQRETTRAIKSQKQLIIDSSGRVTGIKQDNHTTRYVERMLG